MRNPKYFNSLSCCYYSLVYFLSVHLSNKLAAFDSVGLFFTMSHLPVTYLVCRSATGGAAAMINAPQFPKFDCDFTLKSFYGSQNGPQVIISIVLRYEKNLRYNRITNSNKRPLRPLLYSQFLHWFRQKFLSLLRKSIFLQTFFWFFFQN